MEQREQTFGAENIGGQGIWAKGILVDDIFGPGHFMAHAIRVRIPGTPGTFPQKGSGKEAVNI